MPILGGLLPWNALADMRDKGARSTVQRLLHSRHVADLRLLVSIFLVLLIVAVVLLAFSVAEQQFSGASLQFFLAVTGALMALFVSLFSWVYQTGSKRLGVIDLFACEIAAICRVYTVVDLSQRLVDAYDRAYPPGDGDRRLHDGTGHEADAQLPHEPVASATKMKITESYTPVMDHNVGDLQNLDAIVVTNVTEFYTYRRTMLDFMYRWGQETPSSAPGQACEDSHCYYLKQTIYMLFLSLESARRALGDLIDFQPNHAEACINVLLEELTSYAFLMRVTERDALRHRRLALRRAGYSKVYRSYYDEAMLPRAEEASLQWERARTTAEDLKRRYDRTMGSLDQANHLT